MARAPRFWTEGRKPARVAVAAPAGPNRFRGEVRIDRGLLSAVPLVRYTALPRTGGSAPRSFAVLPEIEAALALRRGRSRDLPIDLDLVQPKASRWLLRWPLPEGTRCRGLGERYGSSELRGRVHTLFNTDDPRHTESADALYKSIPLLLLLDERGCIGLFLDSPARSRWDLDTALDGSAEVELLSRRGFRLYVFGPAPLPAVVAAYTRLTGRAPLPPLWSLGHQQSRWSYPTEQTVLHVAGEFRKRKIPCDTVVLDIDYMQAYRVFSVSRERFPNFEAMVERLDALGFRTVVIVDPAVKQAQSDPVYRDGLARGAFCRTAAGRPFVGHVWSGASCLPDFFRAETRSWWGDWLRVYLDKGIAGIWNDMNEPALFGQQTPLPRSAVDLPPDAQQLFLHRHDGRNVGHFELRNAYGLQMARATWEGLLRHRPDERPFVLTRSGYAGMQRYGACWLGDNFSWWEHLRLSIPMLLNLGLSGVPFAGVDIGGFGEDATPELLIRWYQLGIFYPFFRNHCAVGQVAQEPWAFGARAEQAIRRLIEARYRLLPYLEACFVEHRRSGAPILRPLVWEFPRDRACVDVDDSFFLGKHLLVAPIVERGRRDRLVYLPAGRWTRFSTATAGAASGRGRSERAGAVLVGGRTHRVRWDPDEVPAFVRHGAILPLADPVQHTRELATAPLRFFSFGSTAAGTYYEDDGISLGHERGAYNLWQLELKRGLLRMTPVHRGFDAAARPLYWQRGDRSVALERAVRASGPRRARRR